MSPLFVSLRDGNIDIANLLLKVGGIMDKEHCRFIANREKNNKICRCSEKKQFICAQCQIFGYCTKKCQIADWKNHKKLCKLIKNFY